MEVWHTMECKHFHTMIPMWLWCTGPSEHIPMNLLYCQKSILFLQERLSAMNLAQCKLFLMFQYVSLTLIKIMFKIFNKNTLLWNKLSFNITFASDIKETETHYSNMLWYRYVDQVSIGDEVMVLRNDKLIPAKVMNVSSLIMQGNYSLWHLCYIKMTVYSFCCMNYNDTSNK